MLHAGNAPKTPSQASLREQPARAATDRALTADGQAAHSNHASFTAENLFKNLYRNIVKKTKFWLCIRPHSSIEIDTDLIVRGGLPLH